MRRARCHCLAGRTSWTLSDPSARARVANCLWSFPRYGSTHGGESCRQRWAEEERCSLGKRKTTLFHLIFHFPSSADCTSHIYVLGCASELMHEPVGGGRGRAAVWKRKATPRRIRWKWMNNELTSGPARSQTSSCAHRRRRADRSTGARECQATPGYMLGPEIIFSAFGYLLVVIYWSGEINSAGA